MIVTKYFVYFIIYSFFGWIYETCFCIIHDKAWDNRGFLYGPCIPLYGAGATLAQILFLDIPNYLKIKPSYLTIFIGCALGSFVLEYGTSYFLEKRFNARWWDYSEFPFNINGRVCIPFTLCFGFAGIIVTQVIIPPIVYAISVIPVFIVEFLALLFMFLFGMDMALTVSALTSFAKEFERINEQINLQMAERIEIWQTNRADAKLARIEKANERKEAAVIKKEMTAERLAEMKDQISTEAVKQWIINATEPQRRQFRHIAKFTHPVASTKSLLEKGSDFIRKKRDA